jgi:hypothetical protein
LRPCSTLERCRKVVTVAMINTAQNTPASAEKAKRASIGDAANYITKLPKAEHEADR